ncbi:hypothetical protein [Desulfosarcina ovata]|uniref:Uncharacterized protein n=1 Tax=Desulfosarcina ovata subsp. ovata TaxID=2752305 RepID=A0A5K8ACE0_9BACT|nr:hypothetical protein [Desulfosarcina ovata]BBO89674.1 hypothetical protein DSCOOX_28540 [Desulfosarcina ovata subsp. ovata]
MKAKSMICGGLVVCATLFASNLYAQDGGTVGGNLRVTLNSTTQDVVAGKNTTVHLGSAKLQHSSIGDDVTIYGYSRVKNVNADKNASVSAAALMVSNTEIDGDLKAYMVGQTQNIKADKSAQIRLGSADIENATFGKDLNLHTYGYVTNGITAGKNAVVSVAGLNAHEVRVDGGDANFYLQARTQEVEAEKGSRVAVSTAELSNTTFKKGVDIRTNSEMGRIRAEKGAKVSVASANLSNQRFKGNFYANMTARIPGGIKAGKGADVEIGSFTME